MPQGPKALRYLPVWLWFVAAAGVIVGSAPSGWEAIPTAERQPQPPPSTPAPVPQGAAGTSRRAGAWLDAPLTNWNEGLKGVPPAKTAHAGTGAAAGTGGGTEAPLDARCKEQIRAANSSEDRLVAAAGWSLVGSRQIFNDVTLVTAMTGTDGMCRPVGYQAFVFVGGTFAGTLSPVPMDSRTDGMVDRIFLTMPDRVTAEFRRYKDSDALCCPSGGSGVSYRVERKGGRPLLVPEQASATPR